jgi:hypothetical protein
MGMKLFLTKRTVIILSLMILGAGYTYCQSTFSANRPGQIVNPDIVPRGNFMVETGFQYGKIEGNNNFLLPQTAIRYGLNGNIEISLNANNIYEVERSLFGLTSYNIGSKIAICQQKNLLPKITFVTAYIIPFIGLDSLRPENSGGLIQLSLSHTLGDKCTVYSSIGSTWDGNKSYPAYNYVLSVYFSPLNKFWTFVELYGIVPEKGPGSSSSDMGVSLLVADNVQIDFSFGMDLADPRNNHFVQVGAAFQIVKKKK